jgi:amino acid transporter
MKSYGTGSLITFSYVMPLIAYSYVSVEIVIVTAFEARDTKSLRRPSQIIAYFITLLYAFASIAGLLNINWTDIHLPQIGVSESNGTAIADKTPPQSSSIAILAIWEAGFESLAGFINACLIFSLVSVSNTSIYVSSRTLYGMTRKIGAENIVAKILRSFSIVVPKTGVPAAAMMISVISFAWMPFLEYTKGYASQSVSIGGTQEALHY